MLCSTTQQTQPPQATAHPIQYESNSFISFSRNFSSPPLSCDTHSTSSTFSFRTIQLKFVDQPPEKCVYKRNVKPPPVIQIVGGDNFENDGNLYIVVTLIRCDTFQEAPHLLTGNKPVRSSLIPSFIHLFILILTLSHTLSLSHSYSYSYSHSHTLTQPLTFILISSGFLLQSDFCKSYSIQTSKNLMYISSTQ